ncbi:MAG TPA: PAS domain S-box protein [Alphaproteobacteria bacterium]|nr:PAS domain S-box protein [Alphaproteobacteria bacterium]
MRDEKTIPTAPFDSEQLLRLFIRDVRDYALILLDPGGHVVSWNAGARNIKGYRDDEIVGRHFSCFYPPEDVAAGKPARELEIAAREGRYEDFGYRLRKDGSRFWANVVITAIRGAEGELRGFGKLTRDITDRLEAEEKLKDSEVKLRRLVDMVLDTMVDGLVTIDRRGLIRSYNKAAARLFGYAPEEVLGRNVSMLMPEPYRSEHDRYIANYLETRIPKIIGVGREVSGQRKDGSIFPMEIAVGEINGGGEHAFVATIRDLSERREAEAAREQLRQAQKMEALGQLTGGIAHDFNNLLAVILGNLDLLQEEATESTLQEYIAPCMKAALRGSELTQRLLAFGRKQALLPKTISLNDLVTHFSGLLRRTLGERIGVVTTLAADLWTVKIDPSQFEHVLLNLAVNARDAMPGGGKLIIETKNVSLDSDYTAQNPDVTPGDYAMVAVSDTGTGMTPAVAARAFEPFFTTKGIGKGSGLGLSMVYGFVKQSAGHVKIYSEPGKGTSIKIYLPRAEGEPFAIAEAPAAAPARPSGKHVVLAVENDAAVLNLTATMVRSLGYTVVTARSGDEAMRLIEQREDIDILLTDVMLPGSLNGPTLAKQAVALRPGLKILFTSGYAEHAIMESNMLDESVNLIGKPFRKQQLAERLRDLERG